MVSLKNLRTENAILNITLATICFAIMNALVKHLDNIPFFELVFFRALISVVISFFILRANKIAIKPQNPKMMFARGLTGTVSLVLFFYTIQHMPLATAVTIQHLAPIFTMILGVFILKENATSLQWFFVATSFVGVLLVKGFDARIGWYELSLGITAAFASGLTYNLIRKMKDSEPALRIVFFFPLVTLIFVTPFTFNNFTVPQGREIGLLLFLGLDTFVAQYFMTKAYQGKAPGYISVFNYMGVFYAAVLGYLLFDEKLSLLASLGILIIVLSVVLSTLLSYRNKHAGSSTLRSPPRP